MIKKVIMLFTVLLLLNGISTYSRAEGGEMGYFGGISEGSNLPKTIEKYVDNKNTSSTKQFQYKEMVFLSGEPVELEGTIKVTIKEPDIDKDPTGTYTEKYEIEAANTQKNVTLERIIQFNTSYRVVDGEFKKQIKSDSEMTSWDETLQIEGIDYTVDEVLSMFSKSSVEDITPGISYYNTSISYNAEYVSSENKKIVINTSGSIYGYDQPWSRIETQSLTMNIMGDDLQMEIELNPSMEAKKTIYYDKAEPYPISFDGTYNQRMEREASLKYRINTFHPNLTKSQLENSILITTPNQIEKLIIPENIDFLYGHWSEDDFKQLYSLEILTETPKSGMLYEVMLRGEFAKALCLAMNIDISKYTDTKATNTLPQVFGDVPPEHPYYPYVMAAYDAKLVKGSGVNFRAEDPITREAALVILIRIIGLERLSITDNPTTPFADDADISNWARKEIQAGYKLGIVQGDNSNNVLPSKWMSKPHAAVMINRLIKYLREEIGKDYRNLML